MCKGSVFSRTHVLHPAPFRGVYHPFCRLKICSEVTQGHFNDQHASLMTNASAASLNHVFVGSEIAPRPAWCFQLVAKSSYRGFWG